MPLIQGPRSGFSGVFSVMLILLLVVMLTGIVAAVLFGTVKVPEKGGYFSPAAETVYIDGKMVVRIQHRGGDVLSLNTSPGTGNAHQIAIFVQLPSAMVEVRISPSTRSMRFGPGDTIYLYHAQAGYFLSDTGASIHPDQDISPETTVPSAYVVIVDQAAGVTIARLGPF
ncbi:type IV pilin [Methanoregula sp.]|uniref:type IV pilin n=1 Tax=Methanoregula sp. TaxID=2052170 RepID=UPI003C73958C